MVCSPRCFLLELASVLVHNEIAQVYIVEFASFG
jgi:hypothetical protein